MVASVRRHATKNQVRGSQLPVVLHKNFQAQKKVQLLSLYNSQVRLEPFGVYNEKQRIKLTKIYMAIVTDQTYEQKKRKLKVKMHIVGSY